jgi:hypothetical protein
VGTKHTVAATESDVECYSGFTYPQEPRSFVCQGRHHEVADIERRRREPIGPVFRVRSTDGRRWRLVYDERRESWSVTELS